MIHLPNPITLFAPPNLFFIIPHCGAPKKKLQKAPPFELLWLIDFCYKKTNKKRADDLIPEESNTVMLALKRLPPKEAYDRVFRLRRAFQVYMFPPPPFTLFFLFNTDGIRHKKQNKKKKKNANLEQINPTKCSLAHQLLPKDQQTKPEEVREYIYIYMPIALPFPASTTTPSPPPPPPPPPASSADILP